MKSPPAYTSLPRTAIEYTQPYRSVPVPSDIQLVPSHLAMLVAALPPAEVKQPPAYKLLPEVAKAYTWPLTPEPSGAQLIPFHLAM